MNTTVTPSNDVQNNTGGQNVGGSGKYVTAIWIGVLLFTLIASYLSYKCKRFCPPHSSTPRSYSIRTITTENDPVSPRPGIDENTLMGYPTLLYVDARLHQGDTTASGCSICLADYKGSDMIRLLPKCGHIFHLNCIDTWLRLHPTCPICRTHPEPTPLTAPLSQVVPIEDLNA